MAKTLKIILVTLLVLLPMMALLTACGACAHENLTNEQVVLAPTCTADGKGTHLCSDCQETIEFTIPALGHTEVVDAGVDYTCTADGITEGKHCSTCNEVLVAQVVLPAAHRPTEWIVTKEVTCEIDGYRIKNCTMCEERVASEAITKLGHMESDWEITKAATCLSEGAKRTTCLHCSEIMQTAVIDALGHEKTDWIVSTAPTCLSSGLRHKGCTRCTETFEQEVVDALGHFCLTTIVSPTCTTDGYTEEKCTRCTYSRNIDPVAKTGHSYTATVIPPTCNERGYTQHTCNNCTEATNGHAYKDTYVSPLGHQYDNGAVTRPTCLDSGYTTYTCIRCDAGTDGHSYKENYVNPLGHLYNNGIVTQPTCTEQGYTTYACTRCTADTEGHAYKENYKNPIGHEYIEKVDENPTCIKAGAKHNECIRCQVHEPGSAKSIDATGHSISPSIETKDMGSGTTRTATVYRCAGCTEYKHISKIVFTYSKEPNQWLNINTGWCYGMSVDYSDLETGVTNDLSKLTSFRVDVTTSVDISNFIFEKETFADIYITPKGESVDSKLGYLEFLDKSYAIANSEGHKAIDDDSKPWSGYVDFSAGKLIDDHVYFVFINFNASSGYRIKSLSATAVFNFGEPTIQ